MLSVALATVILAAGQPQDRPAFRLETKSEVVHGWRSVDRTTYTYFQTGPGPERELWRITLDEKYLRHWIAENGNVWVVAGGGIRVRPGTFASAIEDFPEFIWVRSPEARDLARVRINQLYSLRGTKQNEQLPKAVIDWEASGLKTHESRNTQFSLVLENFGELHVNELRFSSNPFQYLVTWQEKGAELNPLELALRSQPQLSGKRLPIDFDLWELWPGFPNSRYVLTVYDSTDHSNVRYVKKAVPLLREPNYVVKTPGNRVLMFMFGNGTTDELFVYSGRGDLIGKVDLTALGGFRHPNNAQRLLDYTNVQVLRGNAWVTMAREGQNNSSPSERIKIEDFDGNQYLFKLEGYDSDNGSVTTQRMTAANFSLIKEQPMDGYRVVNERSWKSASGEYVLRVRKVANDAGSELHRLTLLHVDRMVESHYHELWSDLEWVTPIDAFVTDTGRTLVMCVDKVKYPGRPVSEVAMFWARSCHVQFSSPRFNLAHSDFAGSFENAKNLSFDDLKVEYGEPVEALKVEDAIVPQVDAETYTWLITGEKTLRFRLNHASMGHYSFSWVKEQ